MEEKMTKKEYSRDLICSLCDSYGKLVE